MSFLITWLLCAGLTLAIKTKKESDEEFIHILKCVGIGFALSIPIIIVYWLFLLSNTFGPIIWYIVIALLILGAIKLIALLFGFGLATGAAAGGAYQGKKSQAYHAQVFRHGQWINVSGHYHLSSAYSDAEGYAAQDERTRVVDSEGRVQ